MASTHWRQKPSVGELLKHEPYRFNFFQAVRLLESLSREEPELWGSYPVGFDYGAEKETVVFKAVPSLQFPSSDITKLIQRSVHDDKTKAGEMLVTFMGLTGPAGVLPSHYTRMLMNQERDRDHAMRDFFDIFNHRLISFFYRAWRKYRLFLDYERKRGADNTNDDLTRILRGLVGLETSGLQMRTDLPDDIFLYYAGLLSRNIRSASGLEGILSDYFKVPVRLQPLQSRMLPLHDKQCTRLAFAGGARGQFNRLGKTTFLGKRVPNSQNRFRLQVGPLNEAQFADFLPNGTALKPMRTLIEMYVGHEYDFDIQLILDRRRIPELRLGQTRLSWDSWLNAAARTQDLKDVILTKQNKIE